MLTRSRTNLLLVPGLVWLAVFLVVPVALLLVYSFYERGVYGGVDFDAPTLENFGRALESQYLRTLWRSGQVAGLATLLAILLAYPAALAIARAPRRRQVMYLVLVMLPFWSNYLIRAYAWIVLLNPAGLINTALIELGLVDGPLTLLYTQGAVVVGLIYNYCPFVILAIYSSLQRLNPELLEASEDLGAPGWRTFLRVTLPLTLPGIAAGGVFIFVLSIGNFVTPDLLGGKKVQMIGNLVYDQYLRARDWPFGSALALLVIGVMMTLLFLQALAVNRAQAGRRRGV